MIIRRNNSTTLSVDSSIDKTAVSIKNLDGQLLIKINNGSKDIEISKPGDYEYFGVGVTGFEIPTELYSGVINIIKLNVDGVKVVVTTQVKEIPKDILNSLVNIDILAIPLVNANATKPLVNSIEPKKLVIIKSFGGEEVELDTVYKSVGITSMQEVTSVKHKSVDFATVSENTILIGELLA